MRRQASAAASLSPPGETRLLDPGVDGDQGLQRARRLPCGGGGFPAADRRAKGFLPRDGKGRRSQEGRPGSRRDGGQPDPTGRIPRSSTGIG